jgi:hypothetical protein
MKKDENNTSPKATYVTLREDAELKGGDRSTYVSSRGNVVQSRRYHMMDEKAKKLQDQWLVDVSTVSEEIRDSAGSVFFNPYRKAGAYYGAIQSLFLLGSNEWHSYVSMRNKMEELMSEIINPKNGISSWDKFEGRAGKKDVVSCKNLKGRITQNMNVLQRLKGCHPYGEKLKQVNSCIDIRVTEDGMLWYKLNTEFSCPESVKTTRENNSPRKCYVVKKKPVIVQGSKEEAVKDKV